MTDNMPVPPPPWELKGEAVALLTDRLRVRLLVKYEHSPVGPYLEHAIVELTWRGPTVVEMNVDSQKSLEGGRKNWGFPKTLQSLKWVNSNGRITFFRADQIFNFRKSPLRFPIALPFWTVQTLENDLVRVPANLKAKARIGFRGRQIVLILDSFEMKFFAPQQLT